MRFEYEHITQVLPYLFTESDENKIFDKEKGEGQTLKDKFKEYAGDRNFEIFHEEFKAFTSQ